MEPIIRAAGLSKTYRLFERPVDRFLELITLRKRHTEFPALQEVSFEVLEGETIGLIGQNGSGKSTLLKLLCGLIHPTSGEISTRGTIASILELGTGFHPEFSGRDNAILNASILGLSAVEIDRQLPLILEFSELGEFLERPVKTYSSGMYMRLAFSVAVNVDPDILLIDEALAVGDGHFQKKCIDKIREFKERRKTIFFCSHAMYFISTICNRTMWLNDGTLRRFGPTIDVVHEYESFLIQRDREMEVKPEARETPIRIRSVVVTDGRGGESSDFATGDAIGFRVTVDSDVPDQPIHLHVGIDRAADEMQCFTVATRTDGVEPLRGQTTYEVEVVFPSVPLTRGEYSVVVFAGDENAVHVFDRKDLRPGFTIRADRYDIGMIRIDHQWHVDTSAARLVSLR